MAKPWHMGQALQSIVGSETALHQTAATKIGTSYSSLYRWYDRDTLSPAVARRCAEGLGCSLEWLKTGKGDRYVREATRGQKTAERLLIVYQAEMTRLSTRFMKNIVAALADER